MSRVIIVSATVSTEPLPPNPCDDPQDTEQSRQGIPNEMTTNGRWKARAATGTDVIAPVAIPSFRSELSGPDWKLDNVSDDPNFRSILFDKAAQRGENMLFPKRVRDFFQLVLEIVALFKPRFQIICHTRLEAGTGPPMRCTLAPARSLRQRLAIDLHASTLH